MPAKKSEEKPKAKKARKSLEVGDKFEVDGLKLMVTSILGPAKSPKACKYIIRIV